MSAIDGATKSAQSKMMKDFLAKMLDLFGVAWLLVAILSVGVAHNFAFMIPLPQEFWSLVDATFLSGITVQYLFFMSGVLVLSVFLSQLLGVARSFYLGIWVNRLEGRHKKRLYPSAKRERYFDQVRRKIENRIAPIARSITWCLPVAIIGYYYAGWLALVSLPSLLVLFLFSVPILYPTLNFDISYVDDKDEQRDSKNTAFWKEFFSDISTLKQLAAFVMSVAILLSGFLGISRHNYLAKAAQFEFLHSERTDQFSLIGTNAQGYVVFDSGIGAYLLVSYGDISILRDVR